MGAVASFVVLAYGISWSIYALIQFADPPQGLANALQLIVKFGPSLAGIIMAGFVAGRSGLNDILARLLRWRVAPVWYLIAVGGPLGLLLAGVGIDALATGNRAVEFQFPGSVTPLGSLLLIRFFAGGGLGEELGWRGFMLPELQGRIEPLSASLLIGVVHGFWHLPANGLGGSVLLAVLGSAGAILLTTMANLTDGNLLLPALAHASINAGAAYYPTIFPSLSGAWLIWMLALIVLGAIVVAARTGPELCRQAGSEGE